jgi:Methylamine utilisation protein MauE
LFSVYFKSLTMPLRFKPAGLLRVLLGALFLLAGGLKILDPAAFAVEIEHYQLVPWWSCALLALFLPWLEICVGIGLLAQPVWRGALAWATGLLLLFSAALLSAMLRGLSIDCGCFGRVWQSTGTFWPLIRNLVLLGMVFLLWWQPRRA